MADHGRKKSTVSTYLLFFRADSGARGGGGAAAAGVPRLPEETAGAGRSQRTAQ
ncbi:MAG: hypothetical protein L6W00_15075 [Lentisphaeria bacterium]|nr:MAG: hypothetical protein L6W00_15075 [Lentisphaeria bacterium]